VFLIYIRVFLFKWILVYKFYSSKDCIPFRRLPSGRWKCQRTLTADSPPGSLGLRFLCAGFKRRSPIHPPLGVLSSGIRARFLKFESNNSRRSWPEKIHTKVLRRTKGKEGEMHKEDDNTKFNVSDCSKKSGDHKKKSKSKSKSKRIVIESSSSSTSSSDEGL
jgi:hypothetical protein